ncbi:hypothetical protein ABK040_011484 [Willaertia magna]
MENISKLLSVLDNEHFQQHPYSTETWTGIIGSIAFHSILFLTSYFMSHLVFSSYGKLKHKEKVEWCSRIVSTVHAIVSSVLTFYTVKANSDYLDLKFDAFDMEMGSITLQYTFGYFIYDFILLMIYFKTMGGVPMFLHHFFAGVSWGLSIGYQKFAFFPLLYTLTELTTPFINQRWFFAVSDMKESKLYFLNGILMFVSWTVVRIPPMLIVPYVMYINLDVVKRMPVFTLGLLITDYLVISVLNLYWHYLIGKGLVSAIVKSKPKQQ